MMKQCDDIQCVGGNGKKGEIVNVPKIKATKWLELYFPAKK